MRGELNWIVMKCLEKDRACRYESANELAADIGRYLANEPVNAGPPSTTYRLKKFVRRNRVPMAIAAAMVALLIVGITGTTIGMLRAKAAEDAARRETNQVAALNNFLLEMFRAASPETGGDRNLRVADVLERAELSLPPKYHDEVQKHRDAFRASLD